MDRVDRRILAQLQDNAALTTDELARRVGLSPSAVHRRVKRLGREGVIERRVAVLDASKFGRSLFLVGIEVERERPELARALRAWIAGEPNIQQAYYVTGSADYMLLVSAPDVEAFDDLISRMMVANPNVRRFTTNVVMSTVKRSLAIPIED